MLQLWLVSAVVMGLSYTIAHERLFAGLRARCGGRETWLGYLVSCPYCVSHWVAFIVVPLTGTYLIHMSARIAVLSSVIDWFLNSVLVTVVAAFLRVAFFFVDETQGLVRRQKRRVPTAEEEAAAAADAASFGDDRRPPAELPGPH